MKLTQLLLTSALAGSLLAMLPSAATAQSVNQRLENQQRRINQGVRNGDLTRGETRNLEDHDRLIHAQERLDRVEHAGHLTGRERTQLNRELNHNSRAIYRDKRLGSGR